MTNSGRVNLPLYFLFFKKSYNIRAMISLIRKISLPFAKLSIFAIYFWFGLLKVIGQSPASEMVKALFEETVSKMIAGVSFEQFIIAFGIFEMLIGVMFLIGKFPKLAFVLLLVHIFTTALPLFMTGDMVWTKTLIPMLEGQYIIKNLALLGLGFFIVSQ